MANDNCHTPDEFFEKINRVFSFKLDAAADSRNTKCKKYISAKQNALRDPRLWQSSGWVFLNPPFSKKAGGILKWIKTAHASIKYNKGVVCLIICDVSTGSRQYAWDNATEIVELSPRINFMSPGKKGRSGGLQAYQLVIFSKHGLRPRKISRWNWKDEEFIDRKNFNE